MKYYHFRCEESYFFILSSRNNFYKCVTERMQLDDHSINIFSEFALPQNMTKLLGNQRGIPLLAEINYKYNKTPRLVVIKLEERLGKWDYSFTPLYGRR